MNHINEQTCTIVYSNGFKECSLQAMLIIGAPPKQYIFPLLLKSSRGGHLGFLVVRPSSKET